MGRTAGAVVSERRVRGAVFSTNWRDASDVVAVEEAHAGKQGQSRGHRSRAREGGAGSLVVHAGAGGAQSACAGLHGGDRDAHWVRGSRARSGGRRHPGRGAGGTGVMLTLPSSVKLYLATQPTDLRKSFGGLSALVEGTFGLSAMSGDLFIFLNRRGTQVRILFWDRDG